MNARDMMNLESLASEAVTELQAKDAEIEKLKDEITELEKKLEEAAKEADDLAAEIARMQE